jgi:hypothetical protein
LHIWDAPFCDRCNMLLQHKPDLTGSGIEVNFNQA